MPRHPSLNPSTALSLTELVSRRDRFAAALNAEGYTPDFGPLDVPDLGTLAVGFGLRRSGQLLGEVWVSAAGFAVDCSANLSHDEQDALIVAAEAVWQRLEFVRAG